MYSLTVDRCAEVRYQAAAALGNMGYQISLIPLIIAYNFDDDLFVKAEANRAIVRMGAKRRQPRFRE
jgi:HEAT repeat protein